MRLLTKSIVTLASIVSAAGLAIGTPLPAGDIPGANLLPEITGLDFNIGVYATDAVWKQCVDKGDHLKCGIDATDAGAGFLVADTRKPPSAVSRWNGNLQRT
jgi:hypothetical protein